MRLFIAIQLSDELKTAFVGTMHELKKAGVKGNYTPLQNLHLTLAFIGETKEAALIQEEMKKLSFKPFRLTLSEMGSFGDVLWVGMKGNQGLAGIAKSVRDSLDKIGVSYDKDKFVPHITIVRKAAGKWQQVTPPKGEMMVKKISLMKSENKNGKMVYTEIFAVNR